jgi:ribose transport system permease protein
VENVVLAPFCIVLVRNGMNVMQIGSYVQMVLLGSLLILAVVIDQLRYWQPKDPRVTVRTP